MRLPVSTLLKEQPGCGVLIRVVWWWSLLPNSPEDAERYAGKDADGYGCLQPRSRTLRQTRTAHGFDMTGIVGEAGDGGSQVLVARP